MIFKPKASEDVFANAAHTNHAPESHAAPPSAAPAHSPATVASAPTAASAGANQALFGHLAEATPHAAAAVHAAPHAAAAHTTPAPSIADVRAGHAVLKQGQQGPAVATIQRDLHISADGDFGPGTASAVRSFQQQHHLTADAVVGKGTLAALEGGGASGGGGGGAPSSGHELSGSGWVARYPTSASIDALTGSFKSHVSAFVGAMRSAGASVSIAATRRPPERAWLMHYAFLIAQGQIAPQNVPVNSAIPINWVHSTAAESRQAAQAMVNGYDIAYQPALHSKHIDGLAIDMNISWSGTLHVHNASGHVVDVSGTHSGANPTLQAVGRSYGVIKLATDPPHWSDDGH